MLEKRDLFFLQFPDRSELFSIVANEDAKIIIQSGERFSIQEARKKGIKGRLVVRCDVFVRSKNPKG